jgi:hypothetical protein
MLGPDALVALDLSAKHVRNQFRNDANGVGPAPGAVQRVRRDRRASGNPVRWLLRLTRNRSGRRMRS